MKTITAVLTAAALGGAVTAALTVPSATASKDPCTASEVARTVGSVITSVGDYLDSHPAANQAVTGVLQQPAGPDSLGRSAGTLNTYFQANPKVQSELEAAAEPLAGLTAKCKLSIGIPQVLGMIPAAQGQTGLPGQAAVPPMVLR